MDILLSLGVDHTVGYHFLLFLVVFTFLSQVLFKPYFKAFTARVEKTSGSEEHAERLISEAEELHREYEKQARAVNEEHKEIYDSHRSEALKEHESVISAAKLRAKEILDQSKAQLDREVKKARIGIAAEVPAVSHLIVNSVVGKDLM